MKVRLTGQGTRPLLMHNVRLASPLDPYAKKLKELNGKRAANRTDDDRLAIAQAEWEGGLYFDPDLGPYIPATWIFKSLVEGGRQVKLGKKIERGVQVADLENPLIYEGPRDLVGLWGGGTSEFVDIRTVKVGMARVDRCRPIFRKWAFEADLLCDPGVIDLDEIRQLAEKAGLLIGMGDYRMMMGRFTSKVELI